MWNIKFSGSIREMEGIGIEEERDECNSCIMDKCVPNTELKDRSK